MSDLTDFLLARIAEDEAVAKDAERAASDGPVWPRTPWVASVSGDQYGDSQNVEFYYARVLAECEAKRTIVGEHKRIEEAYPGPRPRPYCCANCSAYGEYPNGWPCETLAALLAVYSDHPDYREKWRP